MPNIGPAELILVLVIALIVLGPKRLPGVGRSLGSGIREFKEGISGAGAERRSAEAPAAPDDAERAGLPPGQPPSDTKATHSEVAADVAPAAWAGERVERQ